MIKLAEHEYTAHFLVSVRGYGYTRHVSSRTVQAVTLNVKQLNCCEKNCLPSLFRIWPPRFSDSTSPFRCFWKFVLVSTKHKQFVSSKRRFDVYCIETGPCFNYEGEALRFIKRVNAKACTNKVWVAFVCYYSN